MTARSLVVIAVVLHSIGPQFAPGQIACHRIFVADGSLVIVFGSTQEIANGFLNKQICISF